LSTPDAPAIPLGNPVTHLSPQLKAVEAASRLIPGDSSAICRRRAHLTKIARRPYDETSGFNMPGASFARPCFAQNGNQTTRFVRDISI
jgi:hypothetical protein